MNPILRALVWLDRWVNDVMFRGRWETISGRCWRRMTGKKKCRVCTWLCRLLNRAEADHCRKAYFFDRISNPNLPD